MDGFGGQGDHRGKQVILGITGFKMNDGELHFASLFPHPG